MPLPVTLDDASNVDASKMRPRFAQGNAPKQRTVKILRERRALMAASCLCWIGGMSCLGYFASGPAMLPDGVPEYGRMPRLNRFSMGIAIALFSRAVYSLPQ